MKNINMLKILKAISSYNGSYIGESCILYEGNGTKPNSFDVLEVLMINGVKRTPTDNKPVVGKTYLTNKNNEKIISFDWGEVEFRLSKDKSFQNNKKYTGIGIFYFLWKASREGGFDNYFNIKQGYENSETKKQMDEISEKLKKFDRFECALISLFDLYSESEIIDENKIVLDTPLQVIKFGPPGTGKSHSVVKKIQEHCDEEKKRDHADVITTVFHPDYSYGDFTAKLVPVTVENDGKKTVEYQIHAGPLTKALARAFANPYDNVYLVIEEINRGNTAAIFGDVFQLLDRDECGKSEYPIHIQQLFYEALEQEFLIQLKLDSSNTESFDESAAKEKLAQILKNQQLTLPSNLSIIATMNTSDESVFYMDSAFKRRWHFEYIDVDADSNNSNSSESLSSQINAKVNGVENCNWDCFRKNLNKFIKENKNSIRRIEDKLIGLWFIKAQNGEISESEIKNKLMHYLWDNVFARDKQPLIDKINGQDIVTFGDFIHKYEAFIDAFCKECPKEEVKS